VSGASTVRHDELVEQVLRLYRPEVIREAARRLETRARRWDAGSAAVTERDVQALQFIGEQYGVRTDLLAVLLARLSPAPASPPARLSDRRVRGWIERMEQAGYLSRRRVLGHTWTTPTAAGMALAGLTFERWKFGGARDGEEGWGLEHVHAITRVRLHLQPDSANRAWISERAIRRKWEGTGARVRLADGALTLSDGRVAGVEVELHRKKPDRYDGIVRDVDPDFDEVWWFCPAGDVGWLSDVLGQLPTQLRPVHRVRALPEELGQ
jgi:KaiC/GvpD/RAD55 family RecA-like ATPase